MTEAAAPAFQLSQDLKVDGIAAPATPAVIALRPATLRLVALRGR